MSPELSQDSRAVVLLSGGLDSMMALALTRQQMPVALALTVNYGQRAFRREVQAAQAISAYFDVPHQVIDLPWMATLLPQAMQASALEGVPEDWRQSQKSEAFATVQPVWVPNRNGVLLNIAASFAEAIGADRVVFGANAEEGESFPDNTVAYREQQTQAFAFTTQNQVQVLAPVEGLDKTQMVRLALQHDWPLSLVWSCYQARETQCGECPSCVRLKRALVENGQAALISELFPVASMPTVV